MAMVAHFVCSHPDCLGSCLERERYHSSPNGVIQDDPTMARTDLAARAAGLVAKAIHASVYDTSSAINEWSYARCQRCLFSGHPAWCLITFLCVTSSWCLNDFHAGCRVATRLPQYRMAVIRQPRPCAACVHILCQRCSCSPHPVIWNVPNV